MAEDFDFGDGHVGTVGGAGECCDGFGAAGNYVPGGAFDEYFADEVGFGEFGAGREVWGVEGFGEGEVLFGNDAAGYALIERGVSWLFILFCFWNIFSAFCMGLTDLKMVFMNLSKSWGSMSPPHSRIPMASLGMTVKWPLRFWRIMSHSLSLSSNVLISLSLRNWSNAP